MGNRRGERENERFGRHAFTCNGFSCVVSTYFAKHHWDIRTKNHIFIIENFNYIIGEFDCEELINHVLITMDLNYFTGECGEIFCIYY